MGKRNNVIVTLEYPPQVGGIATYIQQMEASLDSVEVEVLKPTTSWKGALLSIVMLSKTPKRVIVHHVFPVGTAAYIYSKLFKIPYILTFHGMDFDQATRSSFRRFLLKRILNRAEHVITNTRTLGEEVQKLTKTIVKTVHPVLTDTFIQAVDSVEKPSETDSTIITLLTVGRLVKRKNHEAVLRAITELTSVHYSIVGDGPNREHLETLVTELDLQDRVTFYGNQIGTDLIKRYQEADIFIAVSTSSKAQREGFGIVYLEAQYLGLPIIATPQKGVKEAVAENAYFADTEGDVVSTIQKVMKDLKNGTFNPVTGKSFVKKNYLPSAMKQSLSFLQD